MQDGYLPSSYPRASLVDEKGSLLENRWFLGTAIKSWLRAGPYPDAHNKKDAAPKAMEGLPEKKEKQMRRTIALLTTMAMTLLAATSVAMATSRINCTFSGNCYGTNSADYIHGGEGNNIIYGKDGDDSIIGNTGDDSLLGMGGKDTMYGGSGNDLMGGGHGNDNHYGGPGNDTYDGGPGNELYYDSSMDSSDTYWGIKSNIVISDTSPFFTGRVHDGGGSGDSIDLRTLNSSQVGITYYDSCADADYKKDSLVLVALVGSGPGAGSSMAIYNYFDNKGGVNAKSRGFGAIESIRYKNVRDHRFPFPKTYDIDGQVIHPCV